LFALPLIVTSCSSDRPARLVQSRSASENTVQPEAAFRLEATRVADLRPIDRKLIRSGDLRVQVGSVQTASQRADSIATQYGGVVADMHISEDDRGKHTANLVIKIPMDRFAAALQEFRQLGSVKNEAITQEDVTRAYTDLETRLTVKEQTATRLRQLLANHTGTLSDVLAVERELS